MLTSTNRITSQRHPSNSFSLGQKISQAYSTSIFLRTRKDIENSKDIKERIHFSEPLDFTAEQFTKVIQGRWIIASHCDGRSLTINEVQDLGIPDGEHSFTAIVEFHSDKVSHEIYVINTSTPKKTINDNNKIKRTGHCSINLDPERKNVFYMTIDLIKDQFLSIRRVTETNKHIIDSVQTKHPKCEDGSNLRSILVPAVTS